MAPKPVAAAVISACVTFTSWLVCLAAGYPLQWPGAAVLFIVATLLWMFFLSL